MIWGVLSVDHSTTTIITMIIDNDGDDDADDNAYDYLDMVGSEGGIWTKKSGNSLTQCVAHCNIIIMIIIIKSSKSQST